MYGHAWLLAQRCARGCDLMPVCISEVDGALVCVDHASEELQTS